MTEAASAAATAQKLTIVDPQQWHALRAGMPADMLAQVDACVRLEAPALEDEDEADDGGPLADPAIQAVYSKWFREGHRSYNEREIDAIAWAADVPEKLAAVCSQILYRLGLGIFWTRTRTQWAADVYTSPDMIDKAFNVLYDRLKLVHCRTGKNNVAEYRRNDEAVARLCYAWGETSGLDWQGEAARFRQNDQTVKRRAGNPEMFHGLGKTPTHFGQNDQTRIHGLTESKTPPAPPPTASHNERSEGDEDEPATPTPPTDHELAADALIRACGTLGISHEPDAVRSFCRVRNVTTDEAAYAAGVARNATADIDGFAYLKKVIENARKEGRKNRDTPTGGHADWAAAERLRRDLASTDERIRADKQDAGKVERVERNIADLRAMLKPKSRAFK